MANKKNITIIANEVLEGKWGSGETRKTSLTKAGYDYDKVQKEVVRLLETNGSRAAVISNMEAWATKIAANNKYHYIYWDEPYGHECAVCHPHDGKNEGWQCIGFAFAIWHHGGKLKSKCNCGVIDNATWEKILNAKTDAEALKIVKSHVGIDEVAVIRNKNGILKSQIQPGDICASFIENNKYQHTYFIMHNNKVADSTKTGKAANDIRADRDLTGRYVSGCKVIIRYTGNGTASATPTKSVDTIAQEVLDGKWGSGDTRKQKLTAAGYDYDKVQKRVNELLASQKSYQNLKAANYVSDIVYIGQATGDERGQTSGGTAGDQTGGEVGKSKWSYSASASYNHWTRVCRLKDSSKRLIVAQAMIDTCNNNHIGYDIGQPDRFTAYDEAAKVNWDISKITKNCETTCSQAVSMCLRAAGISATWAPRMANVEILTNKIKESGLFTIYTDSAHVAKSSSLMPGDILLSATHAAVVIKAPASTKKAYTGTYPTITIKKSNAQVIADAILWAKWIASDNDFHYGYTNVNKKADAHHNGCYFCKTQRMKKNMLMPEHTYCCNPFIGAAWAHGGCVPAALKLCQNTKSWDFHAGSGYDKSSLFDNLGHPAKSKLKPGDVLCRDSHVAMYIGNGKLIEAGSGDDNKKNSVKWNNSIRIATLTDKRYSGFKRVHRFNGSVKTSMPIKHGEVGYRVANLQKYLDWYFDGKVGVADGCFGDNTLKYVKKFQKARGLTVDGIVGEETIAEMKKVKK